MNYLVFLEEPFPCLHQLALIDAPEPAQLVQDPRVIIQLLHGLLARHEVYPHDPVLDFGGFDQTHPPNLGTAVTVGPATGLNVCIFDFHDSQDVARHDS